MKPLKPGSPEWHARIAALRAEEAKQPVTLWYLSFVDPDRPEGDRFVGGCFIFARGPVDAIMFTRWLGINPGGQVLCSDLGDEKPPPPEKWMNCLMSKAELEAMDKDGDGVVVRLHDGS